MILKIQSSDNLLDILFKNPATDHGLYLMNNRNGVIAGICMSNSEYHCVFQDSKHSYTRYEDNQIDFKSFCSPEVTLTMLTELFRHLLKEKGQVYGTHVEWKGQNIGELDNQPCTIIIDNIWCDSNWYRDDSFLLSRYVPGIELISKEWNLFSLKITGKNITETINKTALVAFFLYVTNKAFSMLDEPLVSKYARILTNVPECPYFIYYLFIKRCCIQSENRFNAVAPLFTKSIKENLGHDVELTRFDTHTDRLKFVRDHLNFEHTLLDYGCGEFRLTKYLSKVKELQAVISYDTEDYSDLFNVLGPRYPNLTWNYVKSLGEVSKTVPLSVIMSEVIEHNDRETIQKEIEFLLDNYNVKQLIITTPNISFNKHYSMDGEFRNDDHKWELTFDQFKGFISEIVPGRLIEFKGIGDRVDNEYVTSGAIITI